MTKKKAVIISAAVVAIIAAAILALAPRKTLDERFADAIAELKGFKYSDGEYWNIPVSQATVNHADFEAANMIVENGGKSCIILFKTELWGKGKGTGPGMGNYNGYLYFDTPQADIESISYKGNLDRFPFSIIKQIDSHWFQVQYGLD